MKTYTFEWDEKKNKINIQKHHVSFLEAQTVFLDEFAIIDYDKKHSTQDEDRYKILGLSYYNKELVVCYCERKKEIIRIISARKANKNERNKYYEEKM